MSCAGGPKVRTCVCTQNCALKARAALLLLPTHVLRQAIPDVIATVASSTSSCQRRPQKLPAPAEPQQPSQTVPCASHAKSSRPNPSHPQATEKVLHVYTTHMHQPSQTAEQPRQACHCCARAVLAHPTSHATAVPELRPRVRIRCFSRFANGHAARRPDARRDRWSRTHGRTLGSTNHHRQSLQSHRPGQTARHTQMF